jgi:biotin carboxyl carrier protein
VKYTVRIGQLWREIDVEDAEDGSLYLTYKGQRLKVDLEQAGDTPLYSLLVDGESYEAFVEPRDWGYRISVDSELFEAEVRAGGRRAAQAQDAASGSGEVAITAPMTGVVAAVNVAAGDAVEKGAVLVVIEAMKMNNEVRAPRAGTVQSVAVKPGDRVEQRARIVVLA